MFNFQKCKILCHVLEQAWANYGLGAICGPVKLFNLAVIVNITI